MADLSYIDKFYDRIVRELPDDELNALADRAPAGQISNPNAVLNPLGASMRPVQKEAETPAQLGIINPVQDLSFQGIAENYRAGREKSIAEDEDRLRDVNARIKPLEDRVSELRKRADSSYENLAKLRPEYQEDPKLTAAIQKAQAEADKDTSRPRDLWSELILSFGPALAGAMTGEAGRIAQLPATREARAMYEGRRKEDLDRAQKIKEAAQKRYELLLKVKSEQRESWDKTQQRELDRAKTLADADVKRLEADQNALNKYIEMGGKIESELSKSTAEGHKQYAELSQEGLKQEEKEKRAKIIAQGQDLKNADNLRKEFIGQPIVKNFQDVQQSYAKIQQLSKAPSAAGDISMIFAYMKMLDPGSVVREGEQATAQNAAGIPDQVRNAYNRLLNGQRLTPRQRADFINQARSIYNSHQSLVSRLEQDYKGLAQQYGTNPQLVVPRSTEPVVPRYKDGDTKQVNGQTFIRKDGKWLPK